MMLLIHNIRLGLATNSSSSHSMIWLNNNQLKAAGLPSSQREPVVGGHTVNGEFGWEYFTASDTLAKQTYLGVTLWQNLHTMGMPEQACEAIVGAFAGVTPDDNSYIDHQSVITLPVDWHNRQFVDEQFWKEFKQFVLMPNLVILGGNDNDSDGHPLADRFGGSFQMPFVEERYGEIVARKDERYGFWTLFHRGTGAKVRFSFADPTSFRKSWYSYTHEDDDTEETHPPFVPQKAWAPELCDIKVTDACPFACRYCYQGSTPEGQHAPTSRLLGIIDSLAELKVFELAIGGGEPTLHPDFISILSRARDKGIVPNFTTRNLAWLRDADLCHKILDLAGAFAFSVDNSDQVKKLAAALDYHGVEHNRVNLHLVMGLHHRYEFMDILKAAARADLRITLLGYKTTGRGGEYQPKDYSWWYAAAVEAFNEVRYPPRLSIDTVLAQQSQVTLKQNQVPWWMYTLRDGSFSAYYDGVKNEWAPSSYAPPEARVVVPEDLDTARSWENEKIGSRAQWLADTFAKF